MQETQPINANFYSSLVIFSPYILQTIDMYPTAVESTAIVNNK